MELLRFDISDTSYYAKVENGALLCDVMGSWKKVKENF